MNELMVQDFDRQDARNFGRPSYFNVDTWLLMIEEYITCDEVERALWLLDNPPAWYRDHYPIAAKRIKDRLLTQFFTAVDYGKDPVSNEQIGACDQDTLRGDLVLRFCMGLNSRGDTPHIFECAPGNYWLPGLLAKNDARFFYYAETLDQDLQKRAAEKLIQHTPRGSRLGNHDVFVAFEIIEHLHNPVEIYQQYLKHCGETCKTIFLSTPKYTFGGGMGDWANAALGHLRAYTPKEFHAFAAKYWPEFKWTMYDGHVMCLVGER